MIQIVSGKPASGINIGSRALAARASSIAIPRLQREGSGALYGAAADEALRVADGVG